MLKQIVNGELNSIILREDERLLLASEAAHNFVAERLKDKEKYIVGKNGVGQCFFSNRIVASSDCEDISIPAGWLFNIAIDSKVYTFIYKEDVLSENISKEAFEAFILLLWRFGEDASSYEEWIGDRIDAHGNVSSHKDNKYDECANELFEMSKEPNSNVKLVPMELTEDIKDLVRKIVLSQE